MAVAVPGMSGVWYRSRHMDIQEKESGIILRTQELCQAIVDQADFRSLKEKMDAFMGNELLKFQFQQVNDLGNMLQMKQTNGAEVKEEEIEQFETLRTTLMGDPVAQGFLEAQEQMRKLHKTVTGFLDKTFELGRRPDFEDLQDGSCCGKCGCN